MFSVYFKDNSAERRKQGNPKSRSNPNGQRETQFGAHSLQRQIGPLMKTTSKPFSRGLLWADTVKRKKVAVAIIYIMTILSGILFGENDSEMFAVFFTKSSKTPSVWLLLRAVIFTRHGHLVPQLSADPVLFFLCISNTIWNSRSLCPHLGNRIFPFSPRLPFAPTAVNIPHDAPDWCLTGRWWIGARARRCTVERTSSSSSRLTLTTSLVFPVSLFLRLSPSLEQTLWRRRRDVTPFTAALEPALPAPLRRFPWQRGFGLRGGSQLIDLGPNRGFGSFLLRWWPRSFK